MEANEFLINSGKGRVAVREGSAYHHLNGQVFPIVETNRSRITLDINGQKTDFYGCEVEVFTESLGWISYSSMLMLNEMPTMTKPANEFAFIYVDSDTDEAFIVEARVTREYFNEAHEGGYASRADLLRFIDRAGTIHTPYVITDDVTPDLQAMELAAIEEYNNPSHRRCAWPTLPAPQPISGSANLVAAKVRIKLEAGSLPIVYSYQDGSGYGLRDVTAIEKWVPDTYVVAIEPPDGDISWTRVQAELETASRVHALDRALERMLELEPTQ